MKNATSTKQKGDALVKMLRLLARFRLATENQLRAVLGDKLPDLKWALEEKIILALRKPAFDGAEILAYALARRGAETLAFHSGQEPGSFPYFTTSRLQRSLFMLEHELSITDVGISLELLTSAGSISSLDNWETTPQRIGTSARILTPKGLERVPLVADAFFGVTNDGKTSWFLLEVDRGTIGIARMRRKFLGYRTWWREKGSEQRFGVKNLRLLVLAPNEKRLRKLKDVAQLVTKEGGSGFFWFGLQEFADLNNSEIFLGRSWQTAASEDRHYLLPDRCPEP